MSEFHPNRQKPVKTKPALTRRRILESWPMLVWIAVGAVAWWSYSSGHVFSRMNGAVDPYQEDLAPAEDGHILAIHHKPGDFVEAGTVVVEMDSTLFRRELLGILFKAARGQEEEAMNWDRQRLSLERELRDINRQLEEDDAIQARLQELRPKSAPPPPRAGTRGSLFENATPGLNRDDRRALLDIDPELAAIEGRRKSLKDAAAQLANRIGEISETIEQLRARAKALTLAASAEEPQLSPELLGSLPAADQQDVTELTRQIETSKLRVVRAGVVDRIYRPKGSYVRAGEPLVSVVGEPERIVAFLPQEHVAELKPGDKVWVAPASNRHTVFESVIEGISARIHSLPDAASPLPNRRIYGRDVTIRYPESARRPLGSTDPSPLLPGQTITVHVREPGSVPLLNRIFHNDDSNE